MTNIGTPGRVYPGEPVNITVDFTDEDGLAYNPTTVTFRMMSPCRDQTNYVYGVASEITRPQTGRYQFIFPGTSLAEAGRWRWRVETTGSESAREGDIVVQDSPYYDWQNCGDYT